MDQALNSQKTPHTSPLRASYGMSFVSILMKNDRVIKGFYCKYVSDYAKILLGNDICGLFYGVTLIPAWISNHMPGKVWDKNYNPFLNFNGCTVEV